MLHLMESVAREPKVKPKLRGSSHYMGFFVALVAGAALVALSPLHGEARTGAAIYAACLAVMLGVSGFYHRPMWSPRVRRVFQKLDHATIFLQIAGSYTAFWTLTPPSMRSVVLLVVMWLGAAVGAATFVVFTSLHRAVRAGTYVVLGLSSLPLVVVLPAVIGWTATWTVIAASALYVAGAVVYARRWPNPNPRVFGYHEVFHLMVVLAAATQFWVIAERHFTPI
jgi:hemolysin III